ncbi:MAG: SAM-dependent methyltransferase [Azonexus sp.]|jgi:predicted nicotinamide N-methyase|nr:SAM-dependent methyltransferase [Azonexus sp.]
MLGYQVRLQSVLIGGTEYRIRSLLDRQQYHDPLGEAEAAGISPSSWSLFGQIWPSARVLAKAMDSFDLVGKRILEIGAGLCLASLVVHKREGDMTASDAHPMSRPFLEENLRLNALGPMTYADGNWGRTNSELGQFDLIIGSDVLYERDQPAQLATFIDRHSTAGGEVLIVDPNRGNCPAFRRAMVGFGYLYGESRADCTFADGEAYRGRFLHFHRGAVA